MKGINNHCNKTMDDPVTDYMTSDTSFFYSSKQIQELCELTKKQRLRIALFCGGPFSGKRRQGREFARKLNKSCNNPTFRFQIDLPFYLEDSKEGGPIDKNIMNYILQEMEQHEPFTEEIGLIKLDINILKFCKFFTRKLRKSQFVFVFDDAHVFAMGNKQSGFLEILKTWTEKCKNVFVVLISEFKYTIYNNSIIHCCKPLEIEDAISFLKDQIQITRETSTNVVIDTPSDDKCKELVKLVECWPFLIMVIAHDLKDYSADEMIALLTQIPLLTLSNEAASKTDQLDPRLNNMLEQLTPVLKKSLSFLGDLPDGGKHLTLKDMMAVVQYESVAVFKKEMLLRYDARSIIERKPIERFNINLIHFMNEHVVDRAFSDFKPSAFNNIFNESLIALIERLLNEYVQGNEDELKRCRQQAAPNLKVMLSEMKSFDCAMHNEAQSMPDCEKVIKAAEDFLKRATRPLNQKFREEADELKQKFYASRKRTVSKDSAIDSDSGSEKEEPLPSVTITPNDGCASGDNSVFSEPNSLQSTVDISGVENPLLLNQVGLLEGQCLPEEQSHFLQGPQSTALVQDSDILLQLNNIQASPTGSSQTERIVASGYDSIPLNFKCMKLLN